MSEHASRWALMRQYIKPIGEPPTLYRFNGIGQTLLGAQRELAGTSMYIKGCWLTFLFIPIVPTGFYIIRRDRGLFRFYGKLSIFAFIKLYRWRLFTYYLSVLAESALTLVVFIVVIVLAYGVSHGIRSALR